MLTAGDDYPIHQTPEPIAFSGTDRNFYDRYFFNGYSADGAVFFAAALGVYPQLDVMDASFSLLVDGRQHNVRASRRLHSERMDLRVGPIELAVIKPLQQLAVRLHDNDSGIVADLAFEGRHAPIEEPRFTRRQGARMFMDYTRMTQNGAWRGSIKIGGEKVDVDPAKVQGTRDRSWGIRPVGAPESQPPPQSGAPQFFWLWAPSNFADRVAFLHTNDDAEGAPWNRRAVVETPGLARTEYERPQLSLSYRSGTRRVSALEASLGEKQTLRIEPIGRTFYMSGLGYTHPVWGHGRDHGELEIACDVLDTAALNDNAPEHMHIQALARTTLREGEREVHGMGVLEQLLIGPHAPSGFTSILDPAK